MPPPLPIIERWPVTIEVAALVSYEEGAGPTTELEVREIARRFAIRFGHLLWEQTGANEVEAEILRATTGSSDFADTFDLLFDLPEKQAKWRKFFEQIPEIAAEWAEADLKKNEARANAVSVTVTAGSPSRHSTTTHRGTRVPIPPLDNRPATTPKPKASFTLSYTSRIWGMIAVAFVAGTISVIAVQRLLPDPTAMDRIERLETILMARQPPPPVQPASDLTINCPPTRVTVRPSPPPRP